MNVVIISGNVFREDYGGVPEHVKNLLHHLSNFNDININLLTFGNKNMSYEKNGIRYIVLKRMKFGILLFPLEMIYDLFRLKREIHKINPDIIHIQSTIPLFSLLGRYMEKKYLILLTLHGYIKEENKFHTGVEKIFNRVVSIPLERSALSKIPYIIALCPQIKNLIKEISKSEIFVVPNGINLGYIQKIQPIKKYDNPTIFYIGILNKRKGVHDLIRSIPLVRNKIQNVKLYIAGTGPYINKLKKLVKDLDLDRDVTFLGFLKDEEKCAYLKSMDIFVLPSYWESSAIVLLEAMACGKPIVTTNVGGNPYVVKNDANGFLVQPGNRNDIAEKLIYLFQNKNLINKMGEESKIRAAEFDWEIIARQTREIYKEITNGSSNEDNNIR